MIRKSFAILLAVGAGAVAALWIQTYRQEVRFGPSTRLRTEHVHWAFWAVTFEGRFTLLGQVIRQGPWEYVAETSRFRWCIDPMARCGTLDYTDWPSGNAMRTALVTLGIQIRHAPRSHVELRGRRGDCQKRELRSNVIRMNVGMWLPFVLTAAFPGWMVLRWLRHRRARRGLCAECGYNLAGNMSGVCPECGTETEQA